MKCRNVAALKILFGSVMTLLVGACEFSREMNRSYLNHPAMDFRNRQTSEPKGMLTGLDAIGSSSSSGVCSTCVK